MICWVDTETTGLDERNGHLLEVALVVTDDNLNEVSHLSTVVRPVGVNLEELIAKCDPVVQEMHTKNGLFAELRAGGGIRQYDAEELLISFLVGPRDSVGVPLAPDGETGLKPIYERGGQERALAGNVALDSCVNCKKKLTEHVLASDGELCPGSPPPGLPSQQYTMKQVTLASQTPLAGLTVGFDRKWLHEHMPKLEALFSYRSIDVSSITELTKRWSPSVYKVRPKAGAAHRALADVRESIEYLRYYKRTGVIVGDIIVPTVTLNVPELPR